MAQVPAEVNPADIAINVLAPEEAESQPANQRRTQNEAPVQPVVVPTAVSISV